jgi:hypothetical protein
MTKGILKEYALRGCPSANKIIKDKGRKRRCLTIN